MANGIVWYLGHSLDGATDNPVVAEGYDEASNLLYQIRFGGVEFGDTPRLVVADADGHLYFALESYPYPWDLDKTPGEFTRVYRRDGSRVEFPTLHTQFVRALAIDPADGSIYSGGVQDPDDSYISLRKHDSSGTLLWSKSSEIFPYYSWHYSLTLEAQTHYITALKIDSSGNLITASLSQEAGEIHKYSTSGTLIWSMILSAAAYDMTIDESDNVYIVTRGGFGYYASIGNYNPDDPSENRIDFTDPPSSMNLVKLDSDGAYVSAIAIEDGASIPSYYQPIEVVYYDSTLYIKTYYNYTISLNNGYFVLFDTDLGFISKDYSVHRAWGYPTIYVDYNTYDQIDINPNDGTVYQAGAQVYDKTLPQAVYYENNPPLSALALPVYLGDPSWQGDRYNIAPALALALSLGLPQIIRDYVGPIQLPSVYRLYLTGGTGTVELPLSSFSCRRGAGVMTINAVVPAITAEQIQQVIDRIAGNLIIKRGIRFSDGTEQLDDMLIAPLDTSGYRFDTGSSSASATLSARDSAEVENPKTRTMRSISYRNSASGKRRIRCAIDTYLRPGDTADLGGAETIIVADISYSVSPTQATMEITEG
ncbi:MAG: hypothetical protein IPK63_18885 [Candidatus Competibacteraceae bacterium]|nr:hypothetical protein [Candidatus Competibacteraceae bacterium]